MVLSLSLLAVWLSSLFALSLRGLRHLTSRLARMIAAVACGLALSSCTSTLWVERHSVPEACLPHPWVALVLSLSLLDVWLSSLLALSLQWRGYLTIAF